MFSLIISFSLSKPNVSVQINCVIDKTRFYDGWICSPDKWPALQQAGPRKIRNNCRAKLWIPFFKLLISKLVASRGHTRGKKEESKTCDNFFQWSTSCAGQLGADIRNYSDCWPLEPLACLLDATFSMKSINREPFGPFYPFPRFLIICNVKFAAQS